MEYHSVLSIIDNEVKNKLDKICIASFRFSIWTNLLYVRWLVKPRMKTGNDVISPVFHVEHLLS